MPVAPDTLENIHPQLRGLAVAIELLHEDPDNANEHGEFSRDTLVQSFTEFGQRKNIVVRREGMIVEAGNGTLAALRGAGWSHIACVICDDDETKAKAFALVDNQAARLSKWNFEQLRVNAEALLAVSYDVTSLGFTPDNLADILAGKAGELAESLGGESTDPAPSTPAVDPDAPEPAIPEPPEVPITQPGDIWILGDHRLICGSCREPDVVTRLLDGAKINVAFTSPPYASQRKYDETSGFKPIKPDDYVDWFNPVQAIVREHLADDGSWFVNIKEHCDDGERSLYVKDLTLAHKRLWGWRFVDELIWNRPGYPGLFGPRFKNEFEPVFHFATVKSLKFDPYAVAHDSKRCIGAADDKKKSADERPYDTSGQNNSIGKALPGNVLRLPTVSEHIDHSAVFPVALPTFFIKAYSDEGDAIFDPFVGSGTTIIAAERLKRRGYGCELSARYCDVIVKRWEAETGREAVRVPALEA